MLLSSHNLAEVEEYCHRVAFIRDGAILAVTDLGREEARHKIVTLWGGGNVPEGFTLLREEKSGRVFRTGLDGGEVLRALAAIAPSDFTVENESMEEYLWSLYGLEDAQ